MNNAEITRVAKLKRRSIMNLRWSRSVDSANKWQRITIQESSTILAIDHTGNEQLKVTNIVIH